MIYQVKLPFPYEVVSTAPCCGEIGRVRAALLAIITAARAYAVTHQLEDRGLVITSVAPL